MKIKFSLSNYREKINLFNSYRTSMEPKNWLLNAVSTVEISAQSQQQCEEINGLYLPAGATMQFTENWRPEDNNILVI